MSSGRDPLKGAGAALIATFVAELAALARGSQSPVDAAAELVIDHGPRWSIELTVKLLRASDKPVIRSAVIATVLAGGGVLGTLPRNRRLPAALVAAGLASVALRGGRPSAPSTEPPPGIGVVALAATALLGSSELRPRAVAGLAATSAAGLLALHRVRRRARRSVDDASLASPLTVALPLPPALDGAEGWAGVVPLMTPVLDFYVTDVVMRAPTVDLGGWRLDVSGDVERPFSLDYRELLELDLAEFDAVMVCIHNRVGWGRVGNQRWTGVPLRTLLDRAGPLAADSAVVTRSVDGWDCSIPLARALAPEAHVVVGMGGRRLTTAHGFPARVFVPGVYGQYSGAKWLAEVRVQRVPNRDYWQGRGWSRGPVPVRPLARIDHVGPVAMAPAGMIGVAGVAWAPPVGVAGVEISVGGGPWSPAEVADHASRLSWRRWRAFAPAGPGSGIRARCIAMDGTVQDQASRSPFPSGASGYHEVPVPDRP
ncbi:MAG: molybdopterin-dependent oxidoreductase [Candidatus Nanopelagicales bacterium]